MNEELFKFNIGGLATTDIISPQCKAIRSIFLSSLSDIEKLEETLSFLKSEEHMEEDTHILLKKGVRGNYGSENLVLDVDSLSAANFWLGLQRLYPEDADLMLLAADANFTSLVSDEAVYAPLFIKGMQILGNVYDVGGEIGAVLLETKYRFDYQLLFLEQALKDRKEYPEDAEDETNELLGEYPFNSDKIKAIQLLVERYTD